MTYLIHIRLGRDSFRDVYVTAATAEQAIAIARKSATAEERRWASFIA